MAVSNHEVADADAYAQLKRIIAAKGLLTRSRRFLVEPLLNASILGAIAVLVVLLRQTWWVLFLALPAAFLFGQMGFVAHEATHNQVLKRSKSNYVLSVGLFNLLLGGSRGWWAAKHNIHHA